MSKHNDYNSYRIYKHFLEISNSKISKNKLDRIYKRIINKKNIDIFFKEEIRRIWNMKKW